MYQLSNKEKQWAKEQMTEMFFHHFSRSKYVYWPPCESSNRDCLKDAYFHDCFTPKFFQECYALQIQDEATFALYTFFRDEVLPDIKI